MDYSIDYNDDAVKDIKDGTLHKKMRKAMSLVVRDSLRNLEEYHKKRFFIRGSAGNPRTHPQKITNRTGLLMKSYTTLWEKGALFGYYGTPLKRAALLENGGTIKPVTAGALAIPTPAARVGVGQGVAPKFYPPGVLFRPNKPGGGKYGWLASNEGGKFKILFILASQAVIPPRPTVKKSAKSEAPRIERRMSIAMELALRGGRSGPVS